MNNEYSREIQKAHAEYADLMARGNDAIGGTWDEFEREHFTPEEIAASDLRVALMGEMIKARQERGLSQKKLEELTGIKQPVIARMEKGRTSPTLDTVMKFLGAMGKTLSIVDLPAPARPSQPRA